MGYVSTEEIPIFTGISLAQMLSEKITEYFADPVHQREFEEWRKQNNNEKNDCSVLYAGSSAMDNTATGAGWQNKRSATN